MLGGLLMNGWIIVGAVIVLAIAAAMLYDHRARRRGWRINASTEEALQNRLDVESVGRSPFLQGGKQDWMTYRHRDR